MKKILSLSLVALLLWACGTTYEASSFLVDKTADFTHYKTYGFVAIDQTKLPPQVTMAHVELIRQAVATELELRGLQTVTADTLQPDLAINLGMYIQNKYEANATTNAYPMGGGPYRYYWSGMNYWTADTQVDVETYKEGTLMVDVIDLAAKKILWHGSVTGVMEDVFKENTAQANLKKACDMMFANFPIPAPAPEKK